MAPKGNATYPDMTADDIAEVLNGWGLSIGPGAISKPTSEVVETIYWACLTEVTGISRESLQQPISDGIYASHNARDDDRHMYNPALTLTFLLYHLVRLTNAAGIEGFSLADIVNPKPGRTLTFLAGIINFVKFTDQFCVPFVEKQKQSSENLLKERDEITYQLEDIQSRIATMKEKMAEDEPKCDQLRQENLQLRKKVLAARESQASGLQELEGFKAEKTALLKRKEILNDELDSVNESILRTKSRIVQSPERIKRTITTMGATANDDKRTASMHEAKARDLQTKVAALHNIERDIKSCNEQLMQIQKEIASLQDAQKELLAVREHRDHKKIELHELQLKRERVKKQLSNAHEKLEGAQRHAEEKRVASHRTIERLQQDYDEMVSERKRSDEELDKLRVQADAIEAEKNEHLRTSEQELNELLAEYWKLRHSIDVYMETLANVLPSR